MQLILLTETWLREHLDAEVSIPNFTIFRCDRERARKRRGRNSGGVAMYIRNDIASNTEVLLHFSNGVIEALCVHVHQLNLVLCTVYRQPDDITGGNRSKAAEFSTFMASLSEVIESLPSPTPSILIGGDFNLPKAAWPSCTPMVGASAEERLMISTLRIQLTKFSDPIGDRAYPLCRKYPGLSFHEQRWCILLLRCLTNLACFVAQLNQNIKQHHLTSAASPRSPSKLFNIRRLKPAQRRHKLDHHQSAAQPGGMVYQVR